MSKLVITLCLYPFPTGAKWVVCESEIDQPPSCDPATFKSVDNTALRKFDPEKRDEALAYARRIASVSNMELLISDTCQVRH